MEKINLIRTQSSEFFNSTGKFPDMIKINENNVDIFKNFNGFLPNSTINGAIGELDGIAVMISPEIVVDTIDFFCNNQKLGTLSLEEKQEKTVHYKFISKNLFTEEAQTEIVKKWGDMKFLDNLEEHLKHPAAIEMEKVNQFLNSMNGSYFIKDIPTIIWAIIKKVLTTTTTKNEEIILNVYDLLLFTNWYYPHVKKYVDDISERNLQKFSENFNPVMEACFILCDYYEYFVEGVTIKDFFQIKAEEQNNG